MTRRRAPRHAALVHQRRQRNLGTGALARGIVALISVAPHSLAQWLPPRGQVQRRPVSKCRRVLICDRHGEAPPRACRA